MKILFSISFLLISFTCFSQNLIENNKNDNSSITNISNKKDASIENNNQLQMIMRDGAIIDPKSNIQYDEQDVIIKEQYLIDKTKNLSEVDPN